MIQFIIQKMRNKKGMVLSLLLGNLFLVSIVCCNLLYTRASLQRMINRSFTSYLEESNRYPATITISASMNRSNDKILNLDRCREVEDIAEHLEERIGLPITMQIRHDDLEGMVLVYGNPRGDKTKSTWEVGALTDFWNHVQIVSGTKPMGKLTEDGFIEVVISKRMMVSSSLVVGDEFTANVQKDKSGELPRFRITGVFDLLDPEDIYWVFTPTAYATELLMDYDLFQERFVERENPTIPIKSTWYSLMDYSQIDPDNAALIAEQTNEYLRAYSKGTDVKFQSNFNFRMAEFVTEAKKVQTTIWVLQVPVFVLLGAFLFMVAGQILSSEQSEISIMKSRGASRGQIIRTYLGQNLMVSLFGFGLGIPAGMFLCQVVGSSNAFLEFVSRKALPMTLQPSVLVAGAAASLFAVLVTTLPVLKYAQVSIVHQKQRKTRTGKSSWWQKSFLDVVILGISIYGLYSFNNQKESLAAAVMDGAMLDPLLYMSSSLFILGAGLFSIRVIPLLARSLYWIGKKHWRPSLYSSFLTVIRTRHKQGFIILFMIFTIAVGVFNAKSARTINATEEQKNIYLNGADLVLKEEWMDNSDYLQEDSDAELTYYEPDFNKYLSCDHVESVTRVFSDPKGSVYSMKLNNVQIMGIHTKEFGQTANFDPSLMEEHWFRTLNTMASAADSIIVSSNFRDNMKVRIGDTITYSINSGEKVSGKVCAFVDYWPGYNPYIYSAGTDGRYVQNDHYLIVGHLSKIQADAGIKPYEVWIKTDGSTQGILQMIEGKNLVLTEYKDLNARQIELKNDPIFQGTNGITTVSFIVILLICSVGFLIYWIMSIHSRQLQFGIFRAMGMTMGEVLFSLINELFFISVIPIGLGTLVGELASWLFIPLIQISYASYDHPLPLRIADASPDILRLFLIIGSVMILCVLILGIFISRIRIAQTIKLGED